MTTQPSCDHDKLCCANLSVDCVPFPQLAAFTFLGKRYEVDSWANLFEKVGEILIKNDNSLSVLDNPCLEGYVAEHLPNSGQRLPQNSRLIRSANVWILTRNSDNTLKSDNALKIAATALLAHCRKKPTDLCFEYYSSEE